VVNIKEVDSSTLTDIANKFSPYLMEFKKRLFFTLSVFVVGMIGGFVYYERIIKFMVNLLSLDGVNIVFTSPFQFISLAISCGVVTGLVISFPLIVVQLMSFLKPALRPKEFKMVSSLLPFAIILFIIGFAFGSIIMKWQIELFLGRSEFLGIGNILDISRLLSVVLLTSVFLGLGFQFPILLLVLMHLGVLKEDQVAAQRRWVYLGVLIFVILLPIDSVIVDLILALPLVLLFEVTLILWKMSGRSSALSKA
jgi:sec-independent protein translocase protein TatC